MGRFITERAVVEQNKNTSKWFTLHNQLYTDDDGGIHLHPRNQIIDGYTYPLGGRMSNFPIEPSIGHDFECVYKQILVVNLTLEELIDNGYVRKKDILEDGNIRTITICEDIPKKYLQVKRTSMLQTNNRFKRMMEAVGISNFWTFTMHKAVFLNLAWIWSGKDINLDNIYKRNF